MLDSLSSLLPSSEATQKESLSLLRRFAGPIADELGATFSDTVRLWRFKNSLRLLSTAQKMAAAAGFEPSAVLPKLLVPLLEAATLETEEPLHQTWAALLANASRDEGVLPSFVNLLAQLSSNEVKILDTLLGRWRADTGINDIGNVLAGQLTRNLHISGPQYQILMGNLLRLGLCVHFVGPRLNTLDGHDPDASVHLTPFGLAFIEACQPPRAPSVVSPPMA